MGINKRLFFIKAHFFFFMAASGPILPYLTVYGKQLGISEVVMGTVTAIVPITFLLAKPFFGFIADYFHDRRKLIFVSLIISLAAFYLCLYFIPPVNIQLRNAKAQANVSGPSFCDAAALSSVGDFVTLRQLFQETVPGLKFNFTAEEFGKVSNERTWTSTPIDSSTGPTTTPENLENIVCNVTCMAPGCRIIGLNFSHNICFRKTLLDDCNWREVPSTCFEECLTQTMGDENPLFRSFEFYLFVILTTLSMIFFNVSNSISDAICFDILGEGGERAYGRQRLWGTIGFGITAFLGGAGMDLWSGGDVKNYTPAFILVTVFTLADVICCLKLKLPDMPLSKNIIKDLSKVLKNTSVFVFLVFATLAGILDGFVIYFMFWFLEDLAIATDQIKHIKTLEGLTVAAETLGGEVIFFLISGKILKKLGFGHTLTLCFFNYALRLGLISLISNPWWILAVEFIMQGPTYALCYTTIVAYANAITPAGTSATMQGIVAGMDDGFGYALGSLTGSFLYKAVGGRLAFQIFSVIALICCVSHMVLHKLLLGNERISNTECRKGEILELMPGKKLQGS